MRGRRSRAGTPQSLLCGGEQLTAVYAGGNGHEQRLQPRDAGRALEDELADRTGFDQRLQLLLWIFLLRGTVCRSRAEPAPRSGSGACTGSPAS